MTVILVLATFVAFILIDYFMKRPAPLAPVLRAATTAQPRLQPAVVAGFRVPDNLRYHPGHTWALQESPALVRTGLDDFAAKIIGKIDSVTLPTRGQWIRQGQKIWSVERDSKKIDMISPIEGSIADINEAAVKSPELARKDPYGEGWLVTVQAPDTKTNFRNLLGGGVARAWMNEAANRLMARVPMPAGALAQDGGLRDSRQAKRESPPTNPRTSEPRGSWVSRRRSAK